VNVVTRPAFNLPLAAYLINKSTQNFLICYTASVNEVCQVFQSNALRETDIINMSSVMHEIIVRQDDPGMNCLSNDLLLCFGVCLLHYLMAMHSFRLLLLRCIYYTVHVTNKVLKFYKQMYSYIKTHKYSS